MDCRRARRRGGRARAAADGFVVAEVGVAVERVVHRPLTARRQSERLEQRIYDALAGFGIPADDSRAARRVVAVEVGVDEGAGGKAERDGHLQAFVERNRLADEQAQDVQNRASGDGGCRVEVAPVRRRRSREVDRLHTLPTAG